MKKPNWVLYQDEIFDKYYLEIDAEKMRDMSIAEIVKLQTQLKKQIRKAKEEEDTLNP